MVIHLPISTIPVIIGTYINIYTHLHLSTGEREVYRSSPYLPPHTHTHSGVMYINRTCYWKPGVRRKFFCASGLNSLIWITRAREQGRWWLVLVWPFPCCVCGCVCVCERNRYKILLSLFLRHANTQTQYYTPLFFTHTQKEESAIHIFGGYMKLFGVVEVSENIPHPLIDV